MPESKLRVDESLSKGNDSNSGREEKTRNKDREFHDLITDWTSI